MSRFPCRLAAALASHAVIVGSLLLGPAPLRSQRPTRPASQSDTLTTRVEAGADADRDGEKIVDERDASSPRTTAGVSFGALSYGAGRMEQATSATVRWRAFPWLSVGMTPTLDRVVEPAIPTVRQRQTRIGLTDLPIEFAAEHAFDIPVSPVLGASLGVTLPIGDSASGFGAGKTGFSFNLSAAIAPIERIGLHIGAGRSLGNVGQLSSLGGGSSEFGDASLSLQATDRLSLNAGIEGDMSRIDPVAPRAASLSGGINAALPWVSALNVSASHGISGATPKWTIAVGVGTEFAALGRTTVNSTSARLRRAFGGRRHVKAAP